MARNDDYAHVAEEEAKPLQDVEFDHDYSQAAEIQALRRSLQRTNLYLRIVLGFIGAAVVGYLFNLLFGAVKPNGVNGGNCKKPTPLLLSPVPDLPDTIVTFREDPVYASRPTKENDIAWDRLLPPGRGFVYIPDHEKYTHLEAGQDTMYGQIYSTSLFHQVHCLGQIRKYTWDLLESIEKNDTEKQQGMVEMLVTHDGGGHLNHCFDYIRQGIQCAGDMTMEWPRTEPNGVRIAVDGWNIPHVCKDWGVIMDYMDKMHFNMSMNDKIAPH